ncbi:hypothetical protein [Pararobbsia alpina]|uniref:Uncharacterized protein n=1 Tax=Pararobbsia alpina TaxID=621374 RepID=A0A6S7B151_9BURK|nr:hypothetical protein [Pararobbsia alpina]CAB3776249.1 hypothetical protein LMG28138_00112 [Pararobbsia alpina]
MRISRPLRVGLLAAIGITGYVAWNEHRTDPAALRPIAQRPKTPASVSDAPGSPTGKRGQYGRPGSVAPSGASVPQAVDLFAAEDWRTGRTAIEAAFEPQERATSPGTPEAGSGRSATPGDTFVPVSVAGTWRDLEGLAVVLDIKGVRRIACNRCNVPDALLPGKLVEHKWRLERIDDDALIFTYLPARKKQRVALPVLPGTP